MTVFPLPVGISAYEADPSDIHVATIPQCATTRRHRVPIRISCAHSGSFSKKLEGRARSFDRPVFKTIFNKNHAFPLKTEPYVDDGTHDGFPSRGRDEKYFRIILRKYGLTGWGLTQPRHHSSIGTRFPFFICRLGGLLVLILARAASVVVLRRLFLVGVVSGLVRHALTPRRVMRHHQNLLLHKWFQTNLWTNICSRDLSLLISPKASKADRGAVGQPLGSNRIEPDLQASADVIVPPSPHEAALCAVVSQLDSDRSEVVTSDIPEQEDVCVTHICQLREQTNVVLRQDADQTKREAAVFDFVEGVADHKVARIDVPKSTLAFSLRTKQAETGQPAPETNLLPLLNSSEAKPAQTPCAGLATSRGSLAARLSVETIRSIRSGETYPKGVDFGDLTPAPQSRERGTP